jgi:type VI secretion system FHA domain protein
MPLTLKIVSKQKHILGADSVRVFSVHGGSIGRASDNDWVLPDPDRYISGHHAGIDYRDGAYYLRDTSTNGVYVNHSDQPVGRGTPIRLHDGDELRMGDYLFRVSIIQVSQNEEEARVPRLKRKEEDPAGLSLKLLSEHADDEMAATVRLADTELDTQTDVDEQRVAALKQQESARLGGGDSLRLGATPELPNTKPFAGERRDFTEAVRMLMEHAGLDPEHVSHEDEDEIIATAGRFIRSATDGLRTLLEQRSMTKSKFRISQTGFQAAGNNPLELMSTTQEALEQMFRRQDEVDPDAYLGPLEAVEDAVRDLNIHQAATLKAMQAAFRDLLDRLEPGELEERFRQTAKSGGLLSGSQKSRYWDLYQEAYRTIAGFPDESFAAVIGARFADAYDREVQTARTREARKKRP